MANYTKTTFKWKVTALLLIAAGYGWAGGHFIPTSSPWVAYLFQIIVLAILFVLSLGFLSIPHIQQRDALQKNWSITGLYIFTSLSLFINIANLVRGAFHPAGDSVGSHNTLSDLVPIGLLIGGNMLWLIAGVVARRQVKNAGV